MEIEPLTFNGFLDHLREEAAQQASPIIVEARIAVTPQELHLLAVQAVRPLETIWF